MDFRMPWVCAAVVFLLCAVPSDADACSCATPGPPCEATWATDSVFVGQVLSIESLPVVRDDSGPFFLTRRVTVRLLESFRGTAGQTIEVRTGSGGGDCGFEFEVGQTYVVYAFNTREGPATSICSRTRAIEDAQEDLSYLRNIGRTPSSFAGVLRGTVQRFDPDLASGDLVETPFAALRVHIVGADLRQELRTKADGSYELQVPTGEYWVSVDAPDGFYTGEPRIVRLRDVRGCVQADFSIRSDGRITGRVVDASGSPVTGLRLHLLRPLSLAVPGKPPREPYLSEIYPPAQTDSAGSYAFHRVQPGHYLIGVDSRKPGSPPGPRSWVLLPGTLTARDARTVVVGVSEHVSVEEFVMPAGK